MYAWLYKSHESAKILVLGVWAYSLTAVQTDTKGTIELRSWFTGCLLCGCVITE